LRRLQGGKGVPLLEWLLHLLVGLASQRKVDAEEGAASMSWRDLLETATSLLALLLTRLSAEPRFWQQAAQAALRTLPCLAPSLSPSQVLDEESRWQSVRVSDIDIYLI
jgi:hypothetical protein